MAAPCNRFTTSKNTMKLSSREWHCVVATSTSVAACGGSKASEFHRSEDSRTIGVWVESKAKYFRKEISSADDMRSYFTDKWSPSAHFRNGRGIYRYPVFFRRLNSIGGSFAILVPFSGLLEELAANSSAAGHLVKFVRAVIPSIYELTGEMPSDKPMSDLPDSYSRIILTGARLRIRKNLEIAQSARLVRSMALSAPELRHSDLFIQLVDAPQKTRLFELDPSLLRVTYVAKGSMSLAFRLDEHGNFHFRPGVDGEYLSVLDGFLSRCKAMPSVFITSDVYPWRRNTPELLSPATAND